MHIIFRPSTGGKRDEATLVVKEEVLTKKIKTLEMQLDDYKKKDEQNKMLRKLKVFMGSVRLVRNIKNIFFSQMN